MLVYLNGKFLPHEQAVISVNDRGFLFGDSLYEVIRSYHGRLFEKEAHLQRLQNGLRALRINVGEFEQLIAIAQQLLEKNDLQKEDAAIYFQITRGAASPRKHAFPETNTPPTVFVAANRLNIDPALIERGVAVITTPDIRWGRCDLKTTNLLANVLANQRAHESQAYEAIFIRDGVVTEGSHSNFFAVWKGTILTHPTGAAILPGITRQVVLKLCRELQFNVEEKALPAHVLPQAQELFLTLTSAEVMPVIRVDGELIADGKPGEKTRRLQQAFKALRSA